MSSGGLATMPGYIAQQQGHLLHTSALMQQQLQMQQQLRNHHSPGRSLPAYSSPAVGSLAMQLQQMSMGGMQSSAGAGVPSTGAINALMMPQMASAASAMPAASAAAAEHGPRLLLDPQQQQQGMPVAAMQQYMAGNYAAGQRGAHRLPGM
jgi:hypothetical protein